MASEAGAGPARVTRQGGQVRHATRTVADGPRWVWSAEVMEVIDAEMMRRGLSLGELARRAGERYRIDPESAERRLRSARRSDSVMDVHTADRYLVLVGRHILDIPCYRTALTGELAPELWPRRGGARPDASATGAAPDSGRSRPRPSRVALA